MKSIHKFIIITAGIIALSFLTVLQVFAQATITGASCVDMNDQVMYRIQGPWTTTTNMNWCVNGGTIVGSTSTCKSGKPVPSITVKWRSTPGTGSVSVTSGIGSASLNITVMPAFQAGGLTSPSSQQVSYNGVPAAITCADPQGGVCSGYLYQWEQSADNTNWSDLSGATAASLTFSSGLTQTTYYRRRVTADGTIGYSGVATVYVIAPLTAGTISPASQDRQAGSIMLELTGTLPAGGNCTGNYLYQWQSGTNGTSFTDITGATSSSYLSYTPLSATIYYRRKVTCDVDIAYSNVAQVKVFPTLQAGFIQTGRIKIAYNTAPDPITGTAGLGGTCAPNYTYQWQKSTDNSSYSDIAGANTVNYQPGNLTVSTWFRRVVSCGFYQAITDPLLITVTPLLQAGSISAPVLNLPYNTLPGTVNGTISTGGNCEGAYTYQWQQSPDGTSFTNITGATSYNYTPGNLTATVSYKRITYCAAETAISNIVTIVVQQGSVDALNMNYVRERAFDKPLITDKAVADAQANPNDVSQVTEYFDGLGRSIQKVSKQLGSGATPKDLVEHSQYDDFGREVFKYMPYVSATTDGNYKVQPLTEQQTFNTQEFPGESSFYTKVDFEASPLNRELKKMSPGASWSGSGRGVSTQYMTNTAAEDVRIWIVNADNTYTSPGAYATGALTKTITINEHGKQEIAYKDKEDNIVLKKVQLSDAPAGNYAGWLSTFYVYDDYNNQVLVITPKAVELVSQNAWNLAYHANIIPEYCYEYKYDQRNRKVEKRMPGAKAQYTVYDKWDRVVLMQDGELRKLKKWVFTKYDALDRVVLKGFYTDNTNITLTQMQALVKTAETTLKRFEVRDNTKPDGYTTDQSFPSLANVQSLQVTWYDDYSWCASQGMAASRNSSFDGKLLAPSNTTYPYPQPMTTGSQARGLTTGTKQLILNGGTAGTVVVNFYNDKGLLCQTQTKQYTGGTDIFSTQYNFAGDVIATHLRHEKGGANPQTHEVVSFKKYNHAGGITSLELKLSGSPATDKAQQTVGVYTYNDLGKMSRKVLGNSASPVETMDYTYHISGSMLSINKNYLSGSSSANYFGMELAYDKTAATVAGTSYLHPQYNGNISGSVWKSRGDGIARKYDYTYDNANRLTRADFVQNDAGTAWSAGNVDFSMYGAPEHGNGIGYDANGNILSLYRNGLKITGSAPIDKLKYSYVGSNLSNRLLSVTEDASIGQADNKLGDFTDANTSNDDYTYDDNGNQLTDKNKRISNITYNFLNLPAVVTMLKSDGTTLGTISYVYDAGGTKLAKIVAETGLPAKTTLYVGDAVYIADTLRYINEEEGRIRFTKSGSTPGKYDYDYFIKDNLGDVRAVLTDEVKTDPYTLLSFEGASGSAEVQGQDSQYENRNGTSIAVASSRIAWPVAYKTYNPPPAGTTNDYSMLVKKSAGAIGAAKLLKVMSGDRIHARVDYWYDVVNANNSGANGSQSIVASLLNALSQSALPSDLIKGNISAVTTALSSNADLASLLNTPASTSGTNQAPKAYLNFVFFDEQLKFDKVNSKTFPVAYISDKLRKTIDKSMASALQVVKNGYVYVYFSNESEEAVYFDNFQLTHERGKLLEETHYYPFGLTMAGISSSALNGASFPENKKKYNGKELERREFSDGKGLELYDYGARFMDPATGRWSVIDKLSDDPEQVDKSPYAYVWNNPVNKTDPDGNCPNCLTAAIGAGIGALIGGGIELGTQLFQHGKVTNWSAVGGSALQGAVTGGVAGFTGGASLAVTLGSSAASNVAGGALNRVVQGKSITVASVTTDAAVGLVSGVGGRLIEKGMKVIQVNRAVKAIKPLIMEAKATVTATKGVVEGQKNFGTYAHTELDRLITNSNFNYIKSEKAFLLNGPVKKTGVLGSSKADILVYWKKEIIHVMDFKTGKAVMSAAQKVKYINNVPNITKASQVTTIR